MRLASISLAIALPWAAHAQTSTPTAPTPGYSYADAQQQRRIETEVITRPAPARALAHARVLASTTHVAGTESQRRVNAYVADQMRRLGLTTELRSYDVWLPHPTEARVWRTSPSPRELPLREPAMKGNATSTGAQWPTVNGYSAPGDVTGDVVYANYGLIEDYAQLDSIGVSVRGKVVVARYGRSFRGIKAREAEKHGAIALILYTDPQDDGYVTGDVLPEGPMRPPHGVQRGSVLNERGDPSTPGWPSTRDARRLQVDSMNVPRIPVVAVGYGNAAELLRGLRGRTIPTGWQGGLPFRYHVGPSPVRARVRVTDDRATRPYKTISNVLGTIRGAELPNELVIIGAHADAWSPGANDNVAGVVSVLEAARAVSEQLRAGRPPRRTIVFATWDAEEWGLIGSSEFVEDDSLRLLNGAVAYLNQDNGSVGLRSFGAGGSPSLRSTLRDVLRAVPHPNGRGSVYDAWRRQSPTLADTAEPAMGDPGGGSDFAGFYNHLGIPHTDWAFGTSGGIYHSQYDDLHWTRTHGDTAYAAHAAAARIGAAMLLRLANAEVVPYDYDEYARTMLRHVDAMDRAVLARGWRGDDLSTATLRTQIAAMQGAARRFQQVRDSALSRGGRLVPATRDSVNAALRRVERALTRPEGLRGRPWFRNVVYAADIDNGYSTMVFPSVLEQVRAGDRALAARELADLVTRFAAASAAIEAAARAVRT